MIGSLWRLLLAAVPALMLAACALAPSAPPPPIVFVHGNGDTAALWMTTLWRFESNGWPRDRLHAVDFPYPQSRSDDAKPQEGRSSTSEQMQYLAGEVDRVLKATGASKVVLIGSSRGGYAIRHYLRDGAGADKVSHVILSGVPNHGVWVSKAFLPGSEFNGAGPFLSALNAPQGPQGDEVTPGPRWMTLRSDNNDKYAQPDGTWIGAKGTPTNVSFDGPALEGATNVVLPGRDHREVAFHPDAFAQMHQFITGKAPATTTPTPEPRVLLDGKVSGIVAGAPSNLPLAGAVVEVFAVDAASGARRGAALLKKTVGADGRWGPLATDAQTALEFVITAPSYAVHHIYCSPFARSSDIVHLRPERLAPAEQAAGAVIVLSRPRGYFGLPRDSVVLDGQSPPPGIPPGVAGMASSRLVLADGAARPVVGEFRSGVLAERVVGRSWPARDNHLVTLELRD